MADKPEKPDVRFYVEVVDSAGNRLGGSQYGNFYARAMILAPDRFAERNPYTLHDPDSYSIPDPGAGYRALAGLEISAQCDDSARDFYGWSVHYRRDRVTLADAENMIKVLRRVDKRAEALKAEYGYPASLAQYCLYHTAGVTGERLRFLRRVDAERDYESTGYRSMNVDDLRNWIDSELAAWRKKHGIAGIDD